MGAVAVRAAVGGGVGVRVFIVWSFRISEREEGSLFFPAYCVEEVCFADSV